MDVQWSLGCTEHRSIIGIYMYVQYGNGVDGGMDVRSAISYVPV